MDFKENDIKKLSLDQLSDEQIKLAFKAFNGFSKLFGKKWIEDHFQGAQIPAQVLYISEIYRYWIDIEGLDKSKQILTRWKAGILTEGVVQEVIILGKLKQAGVMLELFPEVNGRVPDACIFINDKQKVYIEISGRGVSVVMDNALKFLHLISDKAKQIVPLRHNKVGINRQINKEELKQLLEWLESLKKNNKEPVYFKDYGIFHTTSLETGGGDREDLSVKFVNKPRMFSTSFYVEKGKLLEKATAVMQVNDDNAQRVLEAEASQLPKDECGVVVLDISGVIDGLTLWEPLIMNRFQPKLNTRISGVVLISMGNSTQGLTKKGILLVNPFAKKALEQKAIKILEKIFM